jgi:hypothetical protein
MTHTLDANERVSPLDRSCAIDAPTAARSTTSARASKFGTFAITFGITFAILYTVFERLNWPLFTYHPAVGKLDFWMQRDRSGEGPPMYWYGWLALSLPGALVLGWIATMIPGRWLHRATIFSCVVAVLWPATFAFAAFIADQASFDAEFLKSMWISAIPALVGAAAASYFVTPQWAQRVWAGWLLIVPIGGLVVLGYSLKQYFLR